MSGSDEDKAAAFKDFTDLVVVQITARFEELLKQQLGSLTESVETLSGLVRSFVLKQDPDKKTRSAKPAKSAKSADEKIADEKGKAKAETEKTQPTEADETSAAAPKGKGKGSRATKAKTAVELDGDIPTSTADLVVPESTYDPNKTLNILSMFKLAMVHYPDFREVFASRYPEVVVASKAKPVNKKKDETDLWKSIAADIWKKVTPVETETVRQFQVEWIAKMKAESSPDQF